MFHDPAIWVVPIISFTKAASLLQNWTQNLWKWSAAVPKVFAAGAGGAQMFKEAEKGTKEVEQTSAPKRPEIARCNCRWLSILQYHDDRWCKAKNKNQTKCWISPNWLPPQTTLKMKQPLYFCSVNNHGFAWRLRWKKGRAKCSRCTSCRQPERTVQFARAQSTERSDRQRTGFWPSCTANGPRFFTSGSGNLKKPSTIRGGPLNWTAWTRNIIWRWLTFFQQQQYPAGERTSGKRQKKFPDNTETLLKLSELYFWWNNIRKPLNM